jgi:hypothetical protein
MNRELAKELESYLLSAQDLKNLREGLYQVIWNYLEENIDTGMDQRINGVFLTDFNNLLEVLRLLETNYLRGNTPSGK